MMKQVKLWMITAILFFCGTLISQAQKNVRYCMTYEDFVANRWIPIDSLTAGKTKQMCQLKFNDDQYTLKTGDKECDKILKNDVLAVEYAGHLYVNCRNLRCNDIPLDVSNYAQAYRYGEKKICVVAHWINGAALLAAVAGDVATVVAPLPVAAPSFVVSEGLWLNMDKLNSYRCYILEGGANAKGKIAVTRITDEFMEKELANDKALLERYQAYEKKKGRQSAANILPVLMEKGLIKD